MCKIKKVRELLQNVNNSGYLREDLGFCGVFYSFLDFYYS